NPAAPTTDRQATPATVPIASCPGRRARVDRSRSPAVGRASGGPWRAGRGLHPGHSRPRLLPPAPGVRASCLYRDRSVPNGAAGTPNGAGSAWSSGQSVMECPTLHTEAGGGAIVAEKVYAEMVANVLSIAVAAGDAVEAGTTLLLLESMKMEIPVLCESAGTVAEVMVEPGDVVQEGDL